jgi:hypothetical protein
VERLGILDRAPHPVEAADEDLERGLLLQERLGLGVVGPEARVLGELRELRGAAALPLDVKATP